MNWEELIEAIDEDPQGVLMTIYIVNTQSPFGVQSKYIPIEDSELCCNQTCGYKYLGLVDSPRNDQGNIYRVRDFSDQSIRYLIRKPISELSISYREQNEFVNNLDMRDPSFLNLIYVGSDSFTNELLIGSYLNVISEEYQIESFPYYYDYALCPTEMMKQLLLPKDPAYPRIIQRFIQEESEDLNNERVNPNKERKIERKIVSEIPPISPYQGIGFGLYLIEKYPNDTFSNFTINPQFEPYCESINFKLSDGEMISLFVMKPNILRSILSEIISTIESLGSLFDFSHGYLFSDNIKLLYTYDPENDPENDFIEKYSPFQIRIVNLFDASLTINLDNKPHRFYRRNKIVEQLPLNFSPLTITIDDTSYYILDSNFNEKKYQNLRSIGFPFYQSFDLYVFFVSLLLIPSYHYLILGDPSLKELFWTPLWYYRDESTVYNRIVKEMNNSVSKPDIGIIISILRNIKLKCNLQLSHYL